MTSTKVLEVLTPLVPEVPRTQSGTSLPRVSRHTVCSIRNWLRKNPNADYYDRLVAESLRMDLEAALRGL